MRTRTVKLAAVAVALAGIAVGLSLWLTSGSTSGSKPLSHVGYVRLFLTTTIGQTTITNVEQTWPKPPYQDFHDGNGDHCLEWIDPVKTLYDLCFDKSGRLVRKLTP